MITFLRRKLLGAASMRGVTAFMEGNDMTTKQRGKSAIFWKGEKTAILRNDKISEHQDLLKDTDYLVRWGCTSPTNVPLDKQLNQSVAIHEVGAKMVFREKCMDYAPDIVPRSIFPHSEYEDIGTMVLRSPTHAQGKNLWVVNGVEELLKTIEDNPVLQDGWYASQLINKVAEFRVYVGSGRVISVAEKKPGNPDAVAWNVAQGGEFSVVKWGDWNFNVLDVAIAAYNLCLLDFAGVDVMVDADGRAYLIEINSAPSLPLLSDDSVSYRQQCMGKYFNYVAEHGKGRLELGGKKNNWRWYIHPAIWSKS